MPHLAAQNSPAAPGFTGCILLRKLDAKAEIRDGFHLPGIARVEV